MNTIVQHIDYKWVARGGPLLIRGGDDSPPLLVCFCHCRPGRGQLESEQYLRGGRVLLTEILLPRITR